MLWKNNALVTDRPCGKSPGIDAPRLLALSNGSHQGWQLKIKPWNCAFQCKALAPITV